MCLYVYVTLSLITALYSHIIIALSNAYQVSQLALYLDRGRIIIITQKSAWITGCVADGIGGRFAQYR